MYWLKTRKDPQISLVNNEKGHPNFKAFIPISWMLRILGNSFVIIDGWLVFKQRTLRKKVLNQWLVWMLQLMAHGYPPWLLDNIPLEVYIDLYPAGSKSAYIPI